MSDPANRSLAGGWKTPAPSTQTWLGPAPANALAIALVVIAGLYIFRWVFRPEMTFYMDDWSWLSNAVFVSWDTYLTIWTVLPATLFHDRPIEDLVIKLLYQMFGLDHTGYGIVILAIHIANGILFYLLAARLLGSRFYGMMVGILFVINHTVAYPAWWLSILHDSLSLFFCLCAFLTFISRQRGSSLATVLLWILAIKSKESALPFPLLLLAYAFVRDIGSTKFADIAATLRRSLLTAWPILAVFVVWSGFLAYYYVEAKRGRMEGYGPYVPSIDFATALEGTRIYLQRSAFDQIDPNVALFGFLGLALIAIVTFNRVAILGAIGFFASTGLVLFLANQRIDYYAYAAAGYIALMLAALLQSADRSLARILGGVTDRAVKAVVLLALAWFTRSVDGNTFARDFLLANMRETSRALHTLSAVLPAVKEKSNIVVTGLPPGVNLFSHAPCYAIKVIAKVSEIDCRIVGTEAELLAAYEQFTAPKLHFHYDQGDVSLRARSP